MLAATRPEKGVKDTNNEPIKHHTVSGNTEGVSSTKNLKQGSGQREGGRAGEECHLIKGGQEGPP